MLVILAKSIPICDTCNSCDRCDSCNRYDAIVIKLLSNWHEVVNGGL